MHELGIIVHISKTLDEIAKENHLSEIGRVTLEIGEVSGIMHDYLTDCWQYYRKKMPLIKNCAMQIDTLKAVTYCQKCKKTYETVKYGRICPFCNSEDTYLIKGDECSIKEIEAK